MRLSVLLIQGVGFLGTALYFLSYQCRNNRTLFRVQFASYLFYTLHLLFLGAVTGAVSYLVNLLRSFCLGSRYRQLQGWGACGVLCALQIVIAAVTWVGWLSLLPVIANIATTIGGYTHNPRKYRISGMFINSPLWIVYNIFVGSWAGILDEVVSEASMILSIFRYGWKGLDTEESV